MLIDHISLQAGFCQCPNFAQFLKTRTLLFGASMDVVGGVGDYFLDLTSFFCPR